MILKLPFVSVAAKMRASADFVLKIWPLGLQWYDAFCDRCEGFDEIQTVQDAERDLGWLARLTMEHESDCLSASSRARSDKDQAVQNACDYDGEPSYTSYSGTQAWLPLGHRRKMDRGCSVLRWQPKLYQRVSHCAYRKEKRRLTCHGLELGGCWCHDA